MLGGVPASAQGVPADKDPLSIAVFVSSRLDECFDRGDVLAITRLAEAERDRVNRSGGIAGRPLELDFYDDRRDSKESVANVRAALANPRTVAMVGLTGSTRPAEVFDAAGLEIGNSGIPFLSDISTNSVFAKYTNVFTMRATQEEESIPVLTRFIKDMAFRRPAFIGLKDQLFSATLGDGLKTLENGATLAGDYRLYLRDEKLDPAEVAAAVEDLKTKNPDFIVLSVGGARAPAVFSLLSAAGVTPPVFVTGLVETIFASGKVSYPGDVYQLAWEGLPDAYNDRLRQRMSRTDLEAWRFEGRRNPQAPGWASGECKPRPARSSMDVFSSANLRAIGRGAQFADSIAIIADLLKSSDRSVDIATLRARVATGLTSTFASGHGTFQGTLENWSFRPSSRAAVRTPFIVYRPKGLNVLQLAPIQYVRLRNDTLRRIDTLYLDIDLVRAFLIDDNEKTFYAEFYLSMKRQDGRGIERIEFANAFLDPKTNDRHVTVRVLHGGGESDTYPDGMQVFAVSGKFMFEPRFANYPFDTQRFPINLQSKNGDAPFIIQPPPRTLRDKAAQSEGWEPVDQYVGYDEDILPIIDAMRQEPSIVPFYKGSFTWELKREATDYFLTVVVPLAFILAIAYLAIFIPLAHFEAIVTIQVTALLSAVALYLAIPKVNADAATLSDRIFLFDYMAVSLMIGISILRINERVARVPWLGNSLRFVHLFVIPVMVAMMAAFVLNARSQGV